MSGSFRARGRPAPVPTASGSAPSPAAPAGALATRDPRALPPEGPALALAASARVAKRSGVTPSNTWLALITITWCSRPSDPLTSRNARIDATSESTATPPGARSTVAPTGGGGGGGGGPGGGGDGPVDPPPQAPSPTIASARTILDRRSTDTRAIPRSPRMAIESG